MLNLYNELPISTVGQASGSGMKKKDLERKLKSYGYYLCGGTKHEKWTNGFATLTVPRHKEINEITAQAILKDALEGKRKKEEK